MTFLVRHADIALVVQSASADEIDALREALQSVGDRLHFHPSITVLNPIELVTLDPSDRWWSDVQRDANTIKGAGPRETRWLCERELGRS